MMPIPARLHPDLAESVEDTIIGPMIRHELLVTTFSPDHVPNLNAAYEAKRAQLAEAKARGDWHLVILLHERPFRVWALGRFADQFSDAEYWDEVRHTWTDTESVRYERRRWVGLLTDPRPGRLEHAFTDADREALDAAFDGKEFLRIYRGHTHPEKRTRGLSWTRDRERAIWFARRNASFDNGTPLLSTASVSRENILLAPTSRNEAEIVTLRPRSIRTEEVK